MATFAEGGGRVGERMVGLRQGWEVAAYPVELLNLGGHGPGSPVRASITSVGPTLLSRVRGMMKDRPGSGPNEDRSSQMSQPDDAMSTPGEMLRLTRWEQRIGTREREEVVRRLMRHQGSGRLNAQEYMDRVARARAATAASDLHPLLADLEPPEDS